MKWLILLSLLACGRNETPSLLDLEDRDGDQIIDKEEIGIEKYIADFKSLGPVSGKIKIFHDTIIELPFSNDVNLKEKAFDVLVANPKFYKPEEYFSDWNRLVITQAPIISFKSDKYSVHLSFETNEKIEGVELVTGKTFKDLGVWSPYMKIGLRAEEVENLLSGKFYLRLKKKFIRSDYYRKDADETIKEKSYRVYYFDGEKSQILYVSKLLPLEKLLKHLRVEQVESLIDDDFFFSSRSVSETKWYLKSLPNGDQALVQTPLTEMKKSFNKRFDIKTLYITRTNGEPEGAVNLSNSEKSKVYLRIRSSLRHLTKWGITNPYSGTGNCKGVSKIKLWAEEVNLETIIQNLNFFFENQLITQEVIKSSFLESGIDKRGLFWEMKIENAQSSLNMNIAPLPQSEFQQFKLNQPNCSGNSRMLYSPERAFFFEIESFVEKTE